MKRLEHYGASPQPRNIKRFRGSAQFELIVLACRGDRFPGLHRQPAFSDGRCGCRAGADRAQHAGFRRLGYGPAGRRRLPGKIAAQILDDRGQRSRSSASRLGGAFTGGAFGYAAVLADAPLRTLGLSPARGNLCGAGAGDLRRAFPVHAHSDSRRDADAYDRAGAVGFLRALDEEEPQPGLWACRAWRPHRRRACC